MLNRKFTMALAAIFAMALLAGCGGGVSDSTHDRVKDDLADVTGERDAAQGTIDAIAMALDLPAGSSQADILTALTTATADQLGDIRTQLELAGDADSAAIVAAIIALQVEPAPPVFVDQSDLPEDVKQMAGSADIVAGGSATIGEVTYTCATGGEDCTVMVNEDGAAVSTGGMVTAAVAQAYTTRKGEEAAEATRLAMVAATTKAAGTKEMAIAAERDQDPDDGLGGLDVTATGNAAGAYTLAIDADDTTVTITVEGATDADDEDFVAADMTYGRTMHTREHDEDADGNVVEEVVIVRTDIEAPEPVDFAKFKVVAEDGTTTTPQALDVSTDTSNDSPAETFEALDIVAGNLGMVKAAEFTAPAGTTGTTDLTFQHAVQDDTQTPADESMDAAEIMGTFNGAMGTYKCNADANNCTATVDGKGVVSAATGWVFIPAMGATVDEPDYDYVHYGFWLKKTTDEDGVVTYDEVETFAGSRLDPSTGLGSVTGSATYNGGAVGVYVHKTFDNDGTSESTAGHFNADASLTATFAQTTDEDIAPNMLNTLTGTIDNFHLSGGETQGWRVSLSGAIDDGGTAASAEDSDTPFSATFHGATAGDTKPSSVVGEFNAGFSNGSVAGAFGASIEDD